MTLDEIKAVIADGGTVLAYNHRYHVNVQGDDVRCTDVYGCKGSELLFPVDGLYFQCFTKDR